MSDSKRIEINVRVQGTGALAGGGGSSSGNVPPSVPGPSGPKGQGTSSPKEQDDKGSGHIPEDIRRYQKEIENERKEREKNYKELFNQIEEERSDHERRLVSWANAKAKELEERRADKQSLYEDLFKQADEEELRFRRARYEEGKFDALREEKERKTQEDYEAGMARNIAESIATRDTEEANDRERKEKEIQRIEDWAVKRNQRHEKAVIKQEEQDLIHDFARFEKEEEKKDRAARKSNFEGLTNWFNRREHPIDMAGNLSMTRGANTSTGSAASAAAANSAAAASAARMAAVFSAVSVAVTAAIEAIKLTVVVFQQLVQIVRAVDETMKALVRSAAQYNANVAVAVATTDILRLHREMQRARILGKDLTEYAYARGEFASALDTTITHALKEILPLVNSVMKDISASMKGWAWFAESGGFEKIAQDIKTLVNLNTGILQLQGDVTNVMTIFGGPVGWLMKIFELGKDMSKYYREATPTVIQDQKGLLSGAISPMITVPVAPRGFGTP